MELRAATAQDAAGIALIYNDAVANTTAIWNDVQVDVANRAAWIAERQAQGFPVFVAVEGDVVLGYASYGPWRPHDAIAARSSIRSMSPHRRAGRGSALP